MTVPFGAGKRNEAGAAESNERVIIRAPEGHELDGTLEFTWWSDGTFSFEWSPDTAGIAVERLEVGPAGMNGHFRRSYS